MDMVQEEGPFGSISRLVSRLRISIDKATLLLITHGWEEQLFTSYYLVSYDYELATRDIVDNPRHDYDTTNCDSFTTKEVCQNAGCGHYICNRCYLEKVNAKVDDINILCPLSSCGKFVPPSFIKSRLSSEELQRYDNSLKRHYQACRQAIVNREEQRNQEAIEVARQATVNREQGNQEAIEVARRELQKRKKRQRWIWGSIAATITLGSAALAWSYIPAAKPLSEVSQPLKDE